MGHVNRLHLRSPKLLIKRGTDFTFGYFLFPLCTQVRPPPASEALLSLIKEAKNEMQLLVQGNNVDKAADMAITILSVVDNNDKFKQDETVRSKQSNVR